MRAAGLRWDESTLDRFLAFPGGVVSGTTMAIATPDARERRALLAFLATLPETASEVQHRSTAIAPQPAAPGLLTGADAFKDYRADGPGVRRQFTVADLPPPFASRSARNFPSVVDRPQGAGPVAPPGFTVDLFAESLNNPRAIRVGPNGDIFISETAPGRLRVLRANDGAKRAEQVEVFTTGLDQPFGMAFFPPGPNPQWLYVANANAIVRFAYASGDLRARAPAEVVVAKLSKTDWGHTTRDIAFSQDGARMFVSVGAASDAATEGMSKQPPSPLRTWEATHGLGAAWGDEERRADVLVFTPDGKGGETFATGLRNCVGMAIHPFTGDLWCSVNERQELGDNLVPDYITRVRQGAFYGWPWFLLGDLVDPRHTGERPDLVGKVTLPDVLLQAHSSSIEMVFYDGEMFPAEFRGGAFAAEHGSWNRESRTSPKVIRITTTEGVPTGEYEDFMTGFVVDDDDVWGRPAGVAVAHDGALLVSDDASGTVWRVAH
jgi:glucose/arabinose dehydrogenase